MQLFAIDPGNQESAYVLLNFGGTQYADGKLKVDNDSMQIVNFGKLPNDDVARHLHEYCFGGSKTDFLAIERVQAMGMPVGYEVFETCEWIGKYSWLAESYGVTPNYVYRAEEKITLCGDSKAKDPNIRQALIDRFAKHDLKNGKGTKKNPDVFYGFKSDIWAAMAVATTFLEQKAGTGHKAKWRRDNG